jgi:hypothetical protein
MAQQTGSFTDLVHATHFMFRKRSSKRVLARANARLQRWIEICIANCGSGDCPSAEPSHYEDII